MTRLGGTGYLFLRSEAVGERIIDITGNERFHQSLGSKVLSKLSRPGDTVVTTKGNSTGRAAYINSDYPTFVYSPHLSFWRTLGRAARQLERFGPALRLAGALESLLARFLGGGRSWNVAVLAE